MLQIYIEVLRRIKWVLLLGHEAKHFDTIVCSLFGYVYLGFCFPQHRFSFLFSLDHNATIQSAVCMKVMSLILAIASVLPEFCGEMDPNEGLKQGALLPMYS